MDAATVAASNALPRGLPVTTPYGNGVVEQWRQVCVCASAHANLSCNCKADNIYAVLLDFGVGYLNAVSSELSLNDLPQLQCAQSDVKERPTRNLMNERAIFGGSLFFNNKFQEASFAL